MKRTRMVMPLERISWHFCYKALWTLALIFMSKTISGSRHHKLRIDICLMTTRDTTIYLNVLDSGTKSWRSLVLTFPSFDHAAADVDVRMATFSRSKSFATHLKRERTWTSSRCALQMLEIFQSEVAAVRSGLPTQPEEFSTTRMKNTTT